MPQRRVRMVTQSGAGSSGSGSSHSVAGEKGPKKKRLSIRPSRLVTTWRGTLSSHTSARMSGTNHAPRAGIKRLVGRGGAQARWPPWPGRRLRIRAARSPRSSASSRPPRARRSPPAGGASTWSRRRAPCWRTSDAPPATGWRCRPRTRSCGGWPCASRPPPRRDRDGLVADDLRALTGAEAALVVNNNAAAVLLALNTLAAEREVLVSRGELVEIGGSFRIPDVMAKSGARLREVGTTNRTHADDYRRALGPATALILKVHASNYRIVGFTAAVELTDLVAIGREAGVPVVEDLGSGALVDLSAYGLPRAPVVRERIAAGADLVTFSGDKLLGGPQAGIVVGRRELVARLATNPLRRALRPGKLTLAALGATLRLYRESPDLAAALPALRWLTRPLAELEAVGRAAAPLLARRLGEGYRVTLVPSECEVGSGAVPALPLPSRALAVEHAEVSAERIAARFRAARPPVLGRIHDGRFLLDLRGIFDAAELAVDL